MVNALQIHMQDFTNLTTNYTTNPAYYCHAPAMISNQMRAEGPAYGAQRDERWLWDESVEDNAFYDHDPRVLLNDGADPDDRDKKKKKTKPERDGGGGGGKGLARRSGPAAGFGHLIASPHQTHSARELCESALSHGPDFVSLSEGVFCDMDTKTHWPLCSSSDGVMNGMETGRQGPTQVTEDCYHWDTHSLVLATVKGKRGYVAKDYSDVEHWD